MDAFGSSSQPLVAQCFQEKPKQKAKPKKDTLKNDSKPPANPSKGKSSLKSTESTSKTKRKSVETYSFCGKDGHLISRNWKHLEALEEAMHEHHISTSKSSSSLYGKVTLLLHELWLLGLPWFLILVPLTIWLTLNSWSLHFLFVLLHRLLLGTHHIF